MSCQDPQGYDCAKALERMAFFIDRELADADLRDIQRHIDECAPCLSTHDLERTVKALVARSCRERAPQELRARVLVRIREVHVQVSEE
jgi:mycothiol system anti-sigma-R factor